MMITTFYLQLHTVLSYMQEDKAGAFSVMHAYDNRFDIIFRVNSIFSLYSILFKINRIMVRKMQNN